MRIVQGHPPVERLRRVTEDAPMRRADIAHRSPRVDDNDHVGGALGEGAVERRALT